MKRTKILVTYGPAIASPAKIREVVAKGANAIRVNCSHCSGEEFDRAVEIIREGTKASTYPIGLLFDISGPKLRLDRFEGELSIGEGENLTLTTEKTDLTNHIIAVNHPAVVSSVKKGEKIFIDDGNLEFEVLETRTDRAVLKTIQGGVLLPGKGINLPDSEILLSTITEKDVVDIEHAVRLEADFIALSFVRSGDDIIEARRIVDRLGGNQKIFAKLEKREAIDALEEIILLSDGVMIARGDLGVELPAAQVPKLQKRIIKMSNRHFKPVIVATQMLESMRFSPRATRAEISDVANAVFDFTDAVMLSAETATGKYPIDAVRVMRNVIAATESEATSTPVDIEEHLSKSDISHAVARAVSKSEEYVDSRAIFAFTSSGFTAGMISNLFPLQPIIALTPYRKVMNQLTLFRSVYALEIMQPSSFNDMAAIVNSSCEKYKLARKGWRVTITGGAPFGSTVPTNFMMFHEVTE